MSQPLPTYEVYLDTEGFPLDLTSPVRTTDVMYYDSGIWIGRDEDRIFVPYHEVEVIREVEEPETATDEPEAEPTDEGDTEPTDEGDTEPTDEGDTEPTDEGDAEPTAEGEAEPTDDPPNDPVE